MSLSRAHQALLPSSGEPSQPLLLCTPEYEREPSSGLSSTAGGAEGGDGGGGGGAPTTVSKM